MTFARFAITVPALLIWMSGCAAGHSSSTQPSANTPDTNASRNSTTFAGESVTLVVNGLACPLCANNIDKQLKDLPGVHDVRVDLGTGRVHVAMWSGSQVTHDQFSQAVEAGGFTLASVETP